MSALGNDDLDRLENLHLQVDNLVTPLAKKLGRRLVCRRGCSDCCQDGLTVFPIEAELIKARCGDLLEAGTPAPAGGCAFLDESGSCRIYPWRPYVCRTQGLPLRWFPDPESEYEARDICPLNLEGLLESEGSLYQLEPDLCWTIGPWEEKLASLQVEASGSFEPVRLPLRSLFSPP